MIFQGGASDAQVSIFLGNLLISTVRRYLSSSNVPLYLESLPSTNRGANSDNSSRVASPDCNTCSARYVPHLLDDRGLLARHRPLS